MSRFLKVRTVPVLMAVVLALLGTGVLGAAADTKDKPEPPPIPLPPTTQVIAGYPIAITVLDNTQIGIKFTNAGVDQNQTQQFYGEFADGVYLWAAHDSASPMMVYGPATMPGGHEANAYTPVSNVLTGAGTPDNPWVVATVNDVPGTKLRLTQFTSYVNGAEYVKLSYNIEQLGGTEPVSVTLFHAADFRAGADELAYGYHDTVTGSVGDYYQPTTINMYQQFIPMVPASAHQEGTYSDIWDRIGDAVAPGPGLNNVCMVDEQLDAGVALQWNLTIPAAGVVTVSDTALFGPHSNLAGSFSDVAYGAYYYDYIYYLGSHGIANGYSDGTFRPGNNATRAQLAKMLVLAMGWPIDTTNGPHFLDVPVGSTFYDYVETAFNHGIATGYPGWLFKPNANVTRAQSVKMTVLAQQWPINTQGGPHFLDVPVGSTFYDYIETAVNAGIIGGYTDQTFRPGLDVTRGQVSKIIDPTR